MIEEAKSWDRIEPSRATYDGVLGIAVSESECDRGQAHPYQRQRVVLHRPRARKAVQRRRHSTAAGATGH